MVQPTFTRGDNNHEKVQKLNAGFSEIYGRSGATAMAFDFIPAAQHAAIIGGTSTYDATGDLQDLLDVTDAAINFNRGTYLTTFSLSPRSNSYIQGNGATIKCTDLGWTLVPASGYGILNFYNVSNIEIENLSVYGTKLAPTIETTPKLAYFQASSYIRINGGFWRNTSHEGLWAGGGFGSVNHIGLYGLMVEDVGFPNAYYALPAIQVPADYVVVSGCRLKNVGTGIAPTGSYWTVTGNVIENPLLVGIGLGDNATGPGCVIVGNTIKLIGHSTSGVNRRGIDLNPGFDADTLPVIVGNDVLIDAAPGDTQNCRGFKLTSMRQAILGHNAVQVDVRGIGVEVSNSNPASPTTYTADINGIHVHFRTPIAGGYCAGFDIIPGGANATQNLSLFGCKVTGLATDTAHFALDINTGGGGTVNRAVRDFRKTGGRVRLPGGAIAFDVSDSNIPAVINSGESNTFVEKAQFAAGTTGRASMNIPAGAAPSSPTNGDLWADASGLYYRRGGVTYTVTMT